MCSIWLPQNADDELLCQHKLLFVMYRTKMPIGLKSNALTIWLCVGQVECCGQVVSHTQANSLLTTL